MPSEKPRRVEVAFTPEFKRNIRRLARKYRRIRLDVAPVISQIEQGETPGDQIQRVGYTVFKVRISNSDAQRGKSSGYRMLYYLKTPERAILVTIYSKTEQGDITAEEVRQIIQAHEAE
jgi:mRNA-degrading endonuclease RelE of RelBE toxin-antitoxin system